MIFVSYSWINEKPSNKVLEFVDFLRKNGFDACCDIIYKQQETAIDFTEMMAKYLNNSDKVIIVLSKEYKDKADLFMGGVGEEYRYIIKDINFNKNKYILVSFESLTNDIKNKITPNFLKNREIVDLIKDSKENYRELFSKLSNQPSIVFSEVNEMQTKITPVKVNHFSLDQKAESDLFTKLGISEPQESTSISDFDKRKFLDDNFIKITNLIKQLLEQFESKSASIKIIIEMLNQKTFIYEIYKNGQNIACLKIWYGNILGNQSIAISEGLSSISFNDNTSCNAIISCKVDKGVLKLFLDFGFFNNQHYTTYEEAVKEIWKTFIEPYVIQRN